MEKQSAEKTIDALRSEHLREGVSPIRAAIIDQRAVDDMSLKVIREMKAHGTSVDFFGDLKDFKEQSIINGGERTFVISPVDATDKFSEHYRNCTGLILAGIDKETGMNISFLSHQDPHFLGRGESPNARYFKEKLEGHIAAIMDRSQPGTVDAVVFGGNYANDGEDYRNSIRIVSNAVAEVLGYMPVILTGKNEDLEIDSETAGYFDTANRRLYLVRPPQEKNQLNHEYQLK